MMSKDDFKLKGYASKSEMRRIEYQKRNAIDELLKRVEGSGDDKEPWFYWADAIRMVEILRIYHQALIRISDENETYSYYADEAMMKAEKIVWGGEL